MLSPKQLKTIGYKRTNDIPLHLWNQSYSSLFEAYSEDEEDVAVKGQQQEEQNQTYSEFKKMKTTGANEDGTGRRKFSSVKQIEFTFVTRDCSKVIKKTKGIAKKKAKGKTVQKQTESTEISTEIISTIQKLFQVYFQIPVTYKYQNRLVIQNSPKSPYKLQIHDTVNRHTYDQINQKKKVFDALSLIDHIGLEFEYDPETIKIFFIEAPIFEDWIGEIDGRACGDGAAFISYNKNDLKTYPQGTVKQWPSYVIPIMIHECFHTLGFDHCSAWKCLMNTVTNEEFWLCPACVRKLQSELGPQKVGGLMRYKMIVNELKSVINPNEDSWMKKELMGYLAKGEKLCESIDKFY